jgi:hypothetical protein
MALKLFLAGAVIVAWCQALEAGYSTTTASTLAVRPWQDAAHSSSNGLQNNTRRVAFIDADANNDSFPLMLDTKQAHGGPGPGSRRNDDFDDFDDYFPNRRPFFGPDASDGLMDDVMEQLRGWTINVQNLLPIVFEDNTAISAHYYYDAWTEWMWRVRAIIQGMFDAEKYAEEAQLSQHDQVRFSSACTHDDHVLRGPHCVCRWTWRWGYLVRKLAMSTVKPGSSQRAVKWVMCSGSTA